MACKSGSAIMPGSQAGLMRGDSQTSTNPAVSWLNGL